MPRRVLASPSLLARTVARDLPCESHTPQSMEGIRVATVRKKPFWKRPNPKAQHRKLTEARRRRARELARHAGRRYPNLVDDGRVAREARR